MKTIKCVSLDVELVDIIDAKRGVASFSATLNEMLKRNTVIVNRNDWEHPRL